MILILYIILQLVFISQSYIELYHTEDSSSVEFYDCIHYKNDSNVLFCQRSGNASELNRLHQTCSSDSKNLSYADLQELNISTHQVLQWSSSIEKADEYAAYLSNNSLFDTTENTYICNCSNPSIFGKFCEYRLLFNSQSFDQTIRTQFEMKIDDIYGSQLYGNILCYTTLECNYGLLCLDWRNICDGPQNCMDGKDEENCDLLEFNECEDNEYRCANGQCIPDEYWTDGWVYFPRDCMDQTDEVIINDLRCLIDLYTFDCDERLCSPDSWSCGTGQCILSIQRFAFQSFMIDVPYCLSLRDCNFACELCVHSNLWTVKHGLCWPLSNENYSEFKSAMITTDDQCLLRIKCALMNVNVKNKCHCFLDEICQFEYDDTILIEQCSHPIEYPPHGFYRPFLSTFYTLRNILSSVDRSPSSYIVNGSIKCRGYQGITLDREIELDIGFDGVLEEFDDILLNIAVYPAGFESLFCLHENIYRNETHHAPKFDELCWSETTKTFATNKSFNFRNICPKNAQCVSSYRVNDGSIDCYHNQDEDVYNYTDSCTNIRKYRLQCSSTEQPMCLALEHVGTKYFDCKNHYDEFIFGSDIPVDIESCLLGRDSQCQILRKYIEMTTKNNTKETIDLFLQSLTNRNDGYTRILVYRYYCDSFPDLLTAQDESSTYCQHWVCPRDLYQCPKTGQCIEPDWICDGVWDCKDGSDEEGIFLINELSPHNQVLVNLRQRKRQCRDLYEVRPLSTFCDYRKEYPCLKNVENFKEDLWNFTLYKPCIPLSQLGDGIIQCFGGKDEKNTIRGLPSGDTIGFDFLCRENNEALSYTSVCTRFLTCPEEENLYGCLMDRVPVEVLKNRSLCGYDSLDVFCLNGTCMKGVRCDGYFDCEYGEDEYMCYLGESAVEHRTYRFNQLQYARHSFKHFRISNFPNSVMKNDRQDRSNQFSQSKIESWNKLQVAYSCNRGVAIEMIETRTLSCFCPPSYYGKHCEYYSDRLTVIMKFNYTKSFYTYLEDNLIVLQVLSVLIFQDEIIDQYNFRVRPEEEFDTNVKHNFFLLYSRSEKYLKHKQKRYFNRTDIINNQPYSVRFEVYELRLNQTIQLIRLWQFPIYFDYLPSFRLAKILPLSIDSIYEDPCLSNPCSRQSICQSILNQNSTSAYVCVCKPSFFGKDCRFIDENCSHFCAPHSICKPKYNGILVSNQQPFCLCPLDFYGPRCYLKYAVCDSQPCQNNGICVVVFDAAELKSYECVCANKFYGEQCEHEIHPVRIQIKVSAVVAFSPTAVLASVVQFFEIRRFDFDLNGHTQQASPGLQLKWEYHHESSIAPTFAFLKVYENSYSIANFSLYWLYFQQNIDTINVTVELNEVNYCEHMSTLKNRINHLRISYLNLSESIPNIFKYDKLCSDMLIHTGAKCFRDNDYICICEDEHYRAECFGYDLSYGVCSYCRSGGLCFDDFHTDHLTLICVCPRCYYGDFCQFSSELLGFTLDSLIINDLISNQKLASIIYIIIATLIILVGFFNNLCSCLTFIRPKPRQYSTGIYLLLISILNQCFVLIVFLKIIYIILGSNETFFYHRNLNLYSCKILSFLLSSLTRIIYWLMSFVTIERMRIVSFVNTGRMKTPKVALSLSLLVTLIIAGMHIHELVYYSIFSDPSQPLSSITTCITNYMQSTVSTYNRVNIIIHHFVPFLIQLFSILILIVQTARSRARTIQNYNRNVFITILKKKFQLYKEHLILPTIIIFSFLPQAIFSFTYICTEFTDAWKRYLLLTTYFLTFLPQILGFLVYVLPSPSYKEEFFKTFLGKKLCPKS